MWILTNYTDVLCCIGLSDGKLHNYYIVPGSETKEYAHLVMVDTGRNYYLLPYNETQIVKFDKITRSFKNEDFEFGNTMNDGGFSKIQIMAEYNGKFILITNGGRTIWHGNASTSEVKELNDFLPNLRISGVNINGKIFHDCSCQKKESLYVPVIGQDYIVEFNILTGSYNVEKVPSEVDYRLRTIDRDEQDGVFLLTTLDNQRILWDTQNGTVDVKELSNTNKNGECHRAYRINSINVYIPSHERKLYVEKENEIKAVDFLYPKCDEYPEHQYTQYEFAFIYNSKIYFQTRATGEIFVLNPENNKVDIVEINVGVEEKKNIMREVYAARGLKTLMSEVRDFDLQDFINVLSI